MTQRLKVICRVSGIAYVLAWILGLSFGGPNLTLNASYSSVVQAYTTHKSGAVIAFIVAEGITGAMLLTLVLISSYNLRGSADNKNIWLFAGSGIVASLLSFVMSVLGLVLVLSSVPQGTAVQVGHLNDLINRLDGPKMWLLGLMAIGGVRAIVELPKWFKATSAILARVGSVIWLTNPTTGMVGIHRGYIATGLGVWAWTTDRNAEKEKLRQADLLKSHLLWFRAASCYTFE